MKKTNLLFCSFILAVLFAGCQKDEEGLTTDNFKTSAVIQGNVYYSLGQDFTNNYLVDKRMSAKGKTIYLDIQSSEYKPGSVGVVTYTAVLDSAGNYKFTIPVKAQGSTAATIRLEQFVAQRKIYERMATGTPNFKSEDVVFSFTKDISVTKGSITVENINYSFTPVDIPDTYKEYITFKGKLNLAYEKGFRDGALKNATGTNVEVAVNYPELGEQHFGTTVDQNGNYSIQIPVVSKKNSITATIVPVSYIANDFIHYSSPTTQETLSGIYNASSISKKTKQGLSEDIVYDLGAATLFFQPFTAPTTWVSNNLASWVILDPTVYLYPVTLTGGVQAAYEKSYLVGDYSPVAGKTVTVSINMGTNYGTQTYILATDNTGKFNLPIMLPSKKMDINISVGVETYSVTNYTHYLSNGTTLVLNGWYDHSYFTIANKTMTINEFNTTYTLDNLYQLFTPVDNSVKDWYTNLIGWYQIPNKKSSVLISGAIKKAVEGAPDKTKPTAWAVATWSNAANQQFTISILGTSFVGLTSGTGQYNLTYPLSDVLDPTANNNLRIGVSSSITKVTNFNHYADINATAPVQVQGSYSGLLPATTCTITDGTTCTVKDCYMYFTPSTIPTGWSNYNWVIN